MKGMATFKITLDEKKWGLWDRSPLNLPSKVGGERLTPTARVLCEKIFAYTRHDCEEVKGCRFTYEQLMDEYGHGRSTVADALSQLRGLGLVKKVDRDIDGTEYVYDGDPTSGTFYIIPLYLHTVQLFINGEYQKVTPSDVRVLAYLMSECASPLNGGKPERGGGVCRTSYKKLARILRLSVTAVRVSIARLLAAKVIFRPKRHKGVNGRKLSGYEVTAGLYIYKKYAKKTKRTKEEEEKIRTSYYADLRDQSERRCKMYWNTACRKQPKLRTNNNAIRALQKPLAEAELNDRERFTGLRQKLRELEVERRLLLERLGLTLSDVTRQYCCEKCRDEGRFEDGTWCTCYPGGSP